MLGAIRLYSRSDPAAFISNSSPHTQPWPAASGCAPRYTTPNSTRSPNVDATRSKNARGNAGVPSLRMSRVNTS